LSINNRDGERMNGSEELMRRRFAELGQRAYGGIWANTEFLSIAEQGVLMSCARELAAPFSLEGGHPSCERRIAMFGSEDYCGYQAEPPIACVRIASKNAKFADKLEHRDFLGALINLGIRREVLGDIFVRDDCAYLFCMDTIADYIADNLERVRHTAVTCSVVEDTPEELSVATKRMDLNVPSERVDAVVCAVYRLSRTQSQQLFAAQRVFVNARETENPSRALREGDVVSVRGFGRFTYHGVQRETKKGRLYVTVEVPE